MDRRTVLVGGAALGLAACAPNISGEGAAMSLDDTRDALSGFAANVEMWWRDVPFEQRFAKAAEAGFSHIEFWFIDSWKRDAKTLAAQIAPTGLSVAQIVGDTPALAQSDVRDAFLENCKKAVENARTLGTDIVTLTGHQDVEGISKSEALKNYTAHMAAAAPIFEDARVFACIEPFNPYDHPGHFIYGSKDALAIVRSIGSAFMKLNWDLFHLQRSEGNLMTNIQAGADQIAYVQLADSPDRFQPEMGEVEYSRVLRAVRAAGYMRPIGVECLAKDDDHARAVRDLVTLARTVSGQ